MASHHTAAAADDGMISEISSPLSTTAEDDRTEGRSGWGQAERIYMDVNTFFSGNDLRTWKIAGRAEPSDELLFRISQQISTQLGQLHAEDVVHGDLKLDCVVFESLSTDFIFLQDQVRVRVMPSGFRETRPCAASRKGSMGSGSIGSLDTSDSTQYDMDEENNSKGSDVSLEELVKMRWWPPEALRAWIEEGSPSLTSFSRSYGARGDTYMFGLMLWELWAPRPQGQDRCELPFGRHLKDESAIVVEKTILSTISSDIDADKRPSIQHIIKTLHVSSGIETDLPHDVASQSTTGYVDLQSLHLGSSNNNADATFTCAMCDREVNSSTSEKLLDVGGKASRSKPTTPSTPDRTGSNSHQNHSTSLLANNGRPQAMSSPNERRSRHSRHRRARSHGGHRSNENKKNNAAFHYPPSQACCGGLPFVAPYPPIQLSSGSYTGTTVPSPHPFIHIVPHDVSVVGYMSQMLANPPVSIPVPPPIMISPPLSGANNVLATHLPTGEVADVQAIKDTETMPAEHTQE